MSTKTPTDLYILILAENSEMLLEETSKELPMISKSDKDAVSFPIDMSDLESKLRIKFSLSKGLREIPFRFEKFRLCESVSPASASTDRCVILFVSNDEKNRIQLDPVYKFYSTYENDPKDSNRRIINSKLKLG